MRLNELKNRPGARKAARRVGRGTGSGRGKTAGRGHKGAKSRAGARGGGFEGGQTPVYRRMPKRGFVNPNGRRWAEVTLGRIQRAIDAGRLDAGADVNAAALQAAGLFKRAHDGVRVIQGGGALKARLRLSVSGISAPARAAVEAAGGEVLLEAGKAAASGKADESGETPAGS